MNLSLLETITVQQWMRRVCWSAVVAHALWVSSAQDARGGGGPENVFLLVNVQSYASRTIANHFIRFRQLPPGNVLYLNIDRTLERIAVGDFRDKILRPALAAIERRGLKGQIDYLVYSSDFPWSVDLKRDVQEVKLPKYLRPVGSLTGATYLWQWVLTANPQSIGLTNNFYVPPPGSEKKPGRSRGFRGWYGWSSPGRLLEAGGPSYLLSTMLAVTSGRGNSVDQAIATLRRSARSDGSRPKGTIYYVRNGTPRSRPRHELFPLAVADLKRLGIRAEILRGSIVKNKPDVMGAMIGTAHFDWGTSGSKILPGAICDNLTSFGGDLRKNGSQTPLTEFLRYGAAGSSGTVVEPFAIQAKFPLPSIHVHYARGCSLAEAFYQSVSGPYQLLIVGDPLCRPWAVIPKVTARGIRDGATVEGVLRLQPAATTRGKFPVDRFELFVNGRRRKTCRPGESLTLDTRQHPDGHLVVTVVAIESSSIETQGRATFRVTAHNGDRAVEWEATPAYRISATGSLSITARCRGATDILFLQNRRVVATISGDSGQVTLDARRTLGSGPTPAASRWRPPSTRMAIRPG
ncbi:MAG: hypothetical protein ACC645_15360, partial [Pirellulales bacterium]